MDFTINSKTKKDREKLRDAGELKKSELYVSSLVVPGVVNNSNKFLIKIIPYALGFTIMLEKNIHHKNIRDEHDMYFYLDPLDLTFSRANAINIFNKIFSTDKVVFSGGFNILHFNEIIQTSKMRLEDSIYYLLQEFNEVCIETTLHIK